MKRIFGFDLGTTSVGFAVIEVDNPLNPRAGRIERLGVRIFPEGVQPAGGGSTKAPPNQNRRKARLMRRQLRRKRRRRQELGKILADAGLLPRFDPGPGSDWSNLMALDPYEIRADALDQRLPPPALGRALYHLAKRRGFKGGRAIEDGAATKSKEEQDDEGKVKSWIRTLEEQMAGRTLGVFLAEQDLKRFRPASKWRANREMVEDEFDRLWQAQARHHPELLTDALQERLREVAFFQRPTFWRIKTLGRCRLEPDAPLCPKGSWLGQRFLMLQRLNNLRFAFGNQGPLGQDERALVLAELERRTHLTFGQIRKLLKPLWQRSDESTDRRFNFEVMVGGSKLDKTQIPGNLLEAKLADLFGAEWAEHPNRERIRREIFDRLHAIHYRRIGNKRVEIRSVEAEEGERARFIAQAPDYGIRPAQAEALASWNAPSGWLRLSECAIRKLLPHLEAGLGLSEAMDLAYPGHRETLARPLDRLPSHPRSMPDLRNPTVARTLTELRKVTNNLLSVHGKPDLIRIELARDLKLPKSVKDELDKRQRQQEALRKRAREELQQNGFADPSRDDIEKWLLWQECKETCPYTGRKIAFGALFGAAPEFEVEHLLPRSRSFDNGFANKTVSEIAFNRRKGNRTPFEAFGHDAERWQWFKDHLTRLGERERPGRGLAPSKIKRFLRENYGDVDDGEFVARQLNDTAYIAREARAFLRRLDVPVEACNGRVTAQLRDAWGLNKILNPAGWGKSRDDHRHHAVDALTVALTTPALVKRLSEAYARDGHCDRPKLDPPWPDLWARTNEAVERIIVSHRTLRKVSGPLHKETALGDTGEEIVEKGVRYRLYVTRKCLQDLTEDYIESPRAWIRDPCIREIVKRHVAERGGDPKKAVPPYPVLVTKNTGEAREIKKVRICVKRQPQLTMRLRKSGEAWADADEIHHLAIYRNLQGQVTFEAVKRFQVARRLAMGNPIVKRSWSDSSRLVMSVARGDTIQMWDDTGAASFWVVQKLAAKGQITLREHNDGAGTTMFAPRIQPFVNRYRATKLVVDPIGRVTPAND